MSGPSAGASLQHKSVANIKSPTSPSPVSPHTPTRLTVASSSSFGSPSSLRAEEDIVILEVGSRKLHVGFAGDAAPRGTVWFGPDQQRRAGDFNIWQSGYVDDWKRRTSNSAWGREYELWQPDVRGVDLGLVADKLERALREAFTTYLLVDSRPRRMVCVLPSDLPTPFLSTVLDTVFSRFQPPVVSLLSSTVMTTAAAGLRSALVVDIGWTETVVTSVYEYRDTLHSRTIRGGRCLLEHMHDFLAKLVAQAQGRAYDDSLEGAQEKLVSFEECEDVVAQMVWCRQMERPQEETKQHRGLATVHEQEESESTRPPSRGESNRVKISLRSTRPPTTLHTSFEALAEPCENAFFAPQYAQSSFDDHERPVPMLLYRHLLHLPLDVRAMCMSRIIFTGGGADVLGLRKRIFDELSKLVAERGWDSVQLSNRTKPHAKPRRPDGTRRAPPGSVGADLPQGWGGARPTGSEHDGVWHDAANELPEPDPIEEQLKRGYHQKTPPLQGQLRAVDSLGTWSGASLLTQLKVPAIATIDRELWLAQGAAGASRPNEVDLRAQQRQSIGAGGLMRAAAANTNWTLGAWGAV